MHAETFNKPMKCKDGGFVTFLKDFLYCVSFFKLVAILFLFVLILCSVIANTENSK